jgi:hypothetical protein
MTDWRYGEWENTNRTAFTAAITSQTLHGTVWSWNITYWKVTKFQLHDATRDYDCFSTRPKGGVVYEIWDSQGSVVEDPNLLGYYVVSDCKQLLTFCTCIVPSSLGPVIQECSSVIYVHWLPLTNKTFWSSEIMVTVYSWYGITSHKDQLYQQHCCDSLRAPTDTKFVTVRRKRKTFMISQSSNQHRKQIFWKLLHSTDASWIRWL